MNTKILSDAHIMNERVELEKLEKSLETVSEPFKSAIAGVIERRRMSLDRMFS